MPFPRHLVKQWGRAIGWICEVCGRKWKDGWLLESHHIIPTHNGGKDTRDNFKLLCQEHHVQAHKHLANKDSKSARLIEARFKKTGGRWK